MIALLDMAESKLGFWRRLTGGGVTARRADVLGVPCMHISLPPAQNTAVLNRRLGSVERLLRQSGVNSACFAQDFPYTEDFKALGVAETGTAELYASVSDKAAALLARPGSAAYLYAPRLSDAASRTLDVLCRTCRLVMADVPSGDTRRFAELRRSIGVSIVEHPPDSMLKEAETAFFLGVPHSWPALPESCVIYATDMDMPGAVSAARYVSELCTALPEDRERQLPDGFPRAPLIAEALRALTLSRDAIRLLDVKITENNG